MVGRAENGLEKELRERGDIGPAERSALRLQARALDVAEAEVDAHLVSEANRVYLDLRQAAGLTAGGAATTDTFGELLAELSKPTPGVRDTKKP